MQPTAAACANQGTYEKQLKQVGSPRYSAGVLAAVAGLCMFGMYGVAMGQTSSPQKTQPIQEPLDINSIRPAKVNPPADQPADKAADGTAPAESAVPADGTGTAAGATGATSGEGGALIAPTSSHAGQAGAIDGNLYTVSRFVLEWAVPNEQHPSIESLMETPVRLGVTPTGLVAPYELVQRQSGEVIILTDKFGAAIERKGVTIVTKKLKDLADGGTKFYSSAIREINQSLSNAVMGTGLRVVFANPAFDQIANEDAEGDIIRGDDLRPEKSGDLRLVINTGRIATIRSLASGPRLDEEVKRGELTRVDPNDPVHVRVREQSPVVPGNLVQRDAIDDYLFRLNRHPGRRVDAAVSGSVEPGDVSLDYTITENKPWVAYFQISNTGTEATNVWRERFGFVHNQLTKHDDTLRIDYITGGFKEAHAVNLDYTFPLISDVLKTRVYGGYSQYDAADVGFEGDNFDGTNYNVGAELVYNFFQHRNLFIDGTAGLKWQNTEVNSTGSGSSGEDQFYTPYVGVNLEKFTDDAVLVAGLTLSWNADELDAEERDNLGRQDVDGYFSVLRFSAERSRYLEPLFNRLGWFMGEDGKGFQSLAHEVAVSVRGQWAMDNRLIPTEEDVAGGMFSVRGYPESIVAGDDAIIATLEYRFHLPNSFSASDPGYIGSDASTRSKMPEWFGSDFRWAPQQPFSRADWDLVFKVFLDAGSTGPSDQLSEGEQSDTLLGTGIGAELVFRRNVSFRLDWGFALHDAGAVDDATQTSEVESGDHELHFQMTLSY